jgi:hypothetical protein
MLSETHHRGEAERFRSLAATTTDERMRAKLTEIADLHTRIANGLKEGMSETLNKAPAQVILEACLTPSPTSPNNC